jgi:Ca2+:H+ antiporter
MTKVIMDFAEGMVSWRHHPLRMSNLLKPSVYWLFVFAPIAVFLEYAEASAPLIFFSAALSIIPIARLIGNSTEHLSTYTGDAVGGLLNATFGNLPELIIAMVALQAGLHDMVLASSSDCCLSGCRSQW